MARVLFQVVLPIRIKKKPGVYVASCDVLDVHSQGYTEGKARKNIEEAVRLFITGCFEMGTLEEVLKECGFQIAPSSSRKRPGHKNLITVPIPFLAKNHSRASCHV